MTEDVLKLKVSDPPTFVRLMPVIQAGVEKHVVYRERLKSKEVKKLTDALKKNTVLMGLRLPYCYMNSSMLTLLLEGVSNNRSMQWLEFSCDTSYDEEDWTNLQTYLAKDEILRILHLKWGNESKTFVNALSEGMKENHTIFELSLHGAKLGPGGTQAFASMLAVNNFIHTLVLSNAGLLDECIIAICSALSGRKYVKELNVNSNDITQLGAKSLAALLKEETCPITKLSLRFNSIEDPGAFYLADMLQNNDRLTSLDITRNYIKNPGIRKIADSLAGRQGNQKLHKLEYKQSEQIDPRHIQSITESIARNMGVRLNAITAPLEGDDRAAWNCGKLMVVGQAEAGKTATVRALMSMVFVEGNSHTKGIEMMKVVSQKGNIWETDTSDSFREDFEKKVMLERLNREIDENRVQARRNPSRYRPSDRRPSRMRKSRNDSTSQRKRRQSWMQIVSQSLPRRRSSKRASQMPKDAEEKSEDSDGDGENEEKEEEVVDNEDLEEQESSLKISLWDYGGQSVYHTVHHMFLTKHGVYLVVFNMANFLDEDSWKTTKAYLRFWLNTINIHAADAPVIIVGTHAHDVDRSRWQELSISIESITKSMHNIVYNNSGVLLPPSNEPVQTSFFQVDNTDSVGIGVLRGAVGSAFHDQPFLNRKIPYSWVKSLDAMKAKQVHYLRLSTAEKIMRRNGVPRHQFDNALHFLHELGLICHFSKTSSLRNKVIMDPFWLVDEVCKVIRDKVVHPPKIHQEGQDEQVDDEEDREALELARAKKLDLDRDVQDLIDKGLVSTDLIRFFWKEHADFMRDLMQVHLLMGEWLTLEDATTYFVPAMAKSLQEARDSNEAKASVFDDFPEFPAAVFHFDYLPEGVFQRLECDCVRQTIDFSRAEGCPDPVIYRDVIRFHLRTDCVVFMTVDAVQLHGVDTPQRIWVFVQSEDRNDPRRVAFSIAQLLDKLKEELFGEAFRPRALNGAEIQQLLEDDQERVHALQQNGHE